MISIIACNTASYITISPDIKIKEQQAIEFFLARERAGCRLFSIECALEIQAQSDSSSMMCRSEREFLRDFVWEIGFQPLSL